MNPYGEHEMRPEGQLAVLFYWQTYSVRLFETEGMVYEVRTGVRSSMKRELFLSYSDIMRSMSLRQALTHIRELTTKRNYSLYDARDKATGEIPPHDPSVPSSVCKALWEVLQTVGDRVNRVPGGGKGDEDVYKFDVARLSGDEGDKIVKNFPKQARQILEMIRKSGAPKIREAELQKMMNNLVAFGGMKTRQDPWKIFQFYAPQFYNAHLVTYPGRRVRDDEDSGEITAESSAGYSEDPDPCESRAAAS